MKIKFYYNRLFVGTNNNQQSEFYKGISFFRFLLISSASMYVATRRNSSYTVNAATFAAACEIMKTKPPYSRSLTNDVILWRPYRVQTTYLSLQDIGDGVIINDPTSPPDSFEIRVKNVFSSSAVNTWHNKLIINNKTSKTGATVTFNSTTANPNNLYMLPSL